ncbi:MAG: radical SAM protein [Desulfovibrio sp.]|jgi:radical SAM protein with 4Fe4S-binding SPASM domain|nr:radical SAM protein [Desulfovibrio sp.]
MPGKAVVAPGVVLKNSLKVLTRPWMLTRLARLEADKLFFDLMHRNPADGRAAGIRQLSVRITDRCNLRCHTCGQWGDKGFLHGEPLRELTARELPPERYIALLDDLAAHGHRPTVYLWGGEPMLYRGSLDILEHATRLRMPAMIATNGTGLEAAAERITAMPMLLLQVSVDGHDAVTHNAARPAAGKGDNFRAVREGLAAVNAEKARRKSRLPLTAALTTISTANARHLLDIYEAFKDSVDLFVFYLSWWIDEASAGAHDADFTRRFGFTPKLHRGWIGDWVNKDAKALAGQLRELERRSAGPAAPAVNILPRLTSADDLREYYGNHAATFGFDRCISIFRAVEIDSDGSMSPCRDYHDYIVGNVREATVTELWNNARYRAFRASLSKDGLMPVCTRCCGLMGY